MAAPRKQSLRRTQRSTPQNPEPELIDEEELLTDDEETDEPDEQDDDTEETDEQDDPTPVAPVEPVSPSEVVRTRVPGSPQDGRTYLPGETVIFKGEQRGGVIIVSEPVYRAVQVPRTDRFRFHLLLARGSEIPASRTAPAEGGEFQSTGELTH